MWSPAVTEKDPRKSTEVPEVTATFKTIGVFEKIVHIAGPRLT